MNIIADSGNNSLSLENPDLSRDCSRYFAQIKESTLAFLRCGRSFDLEQQRLQAEHGKNKGNKLFKELIASLGWNPNTSREAIALYQKYSRLPFSLRKQLHKLPQLWRIEDLKRLLKLALGPIAKAIAEAAKSLCTVPKKLIAQFAPKKYLKPGELITEENWEAIAELITQKLGLDKGQLEEIRFSAQAIAQGEALTTDHLVIALSRNDYEIDSLFPPPKAKAYKPEEIEQIKTEAKAQAITEAREQVMAEIQPRLTALEEERTSDRTLIEQLQKQLQQLQTLLQRSPTQPADSTVGAQALAALLTGDTHPAASVPSFGKSKTRQPDWMRLNAQPPVNSPSPEFVKPPKSPRLGKR